VPSTLIISHPKGVGEDPILMPRAIAHEKIVKMTGVLVYGGVCSGGLEIQVGSRHTSMGAAMGKFAQLFFTIRF
jgi:hypothetical protein